MHVGENRRLVVSISNNDAALLKFVKEIVGAGKVTTKKTYSERHACSFTYQISSRQALDLLQQISPYLNTYNCMPSPAAGATSSPARARTVAP